MTNVLRPLPVDEFVHLAAHAGLEVTRDDLEQLERRRLIQPYDSGSYSRLHLYLLAVYFDAIRCHRHPWAMRQSSRTMDQVKEASRAVGEAIEALDADPPDEEQAEQIASLAIDVERFLASIDPFGPIADILDLLRDDVRTSLRGVGRLYTELHLTATALAATAEDHGASVSVSPDPTTREVPEDVLRETAELTTDEVRAVATGPSPRDEEESEPDVVVEVVEEPSEPSEPEELSEPSEPEELSEPSEPEELSEPSEPEELSEPSEPEELSEPSEPEELAEPSEPEERPAARQENPFATASTDESDDDFDDFDAEDTQLTDTNGDEEPEETDDDAFAARSDVDSEPEELGSTSEAEEVPPEKPDNPFARETPSGRTQALLDRLDEIKAQRSEVDVLEEESEQEEAQGGGQNLEEKVNELNLLRQELIQAQDWAGLVNLYEERMDLFEDPSDRQQVFLTLATLYELKLDDDEQAFRCFDAAFDIPVRAGQLKALDNLRKIGARGDVYDRYSSWLERQLPRAVDREVRNRMQQDLADAHRDAGHPQRAFLSYAAYLAEDPTRIDTTTIDFLDELSIEVDDSELAGFFDDILEHDAPDEVKALVALRAGTFYLGSNEPHHAIRHFRIAFDLDSSSDVAYSNLARLYEREENWGDLRSLIAEKLKVAEGEEAQRLRRELGRIVNEEAASTEGDSP